MPEYYFSMKHNSWVKECSKCDTVYLGGQSANKAEEILSKYFASDKYRTDGFYGICRECVAKANQAKRDGRICSPEKMLRDQNNKCAICETEISLGRQPYTKTKAYVDHDHDSNKVRGLLCHRCNCRLGPIEDKEWLKKALAYLEQFQ